MYIYMWTGVLWGRRNRGGGRGGCWGYGWWKDLFLMI